MRLSDQERQQYIVVDGNELQNVTLSPSQEQRFLIDLPRKTYACGQLVLVFELNGRGSNAVVSELNLYSSNPTPPQPFEGKEKEALSQTVTYRIDTEVDAETFIRPGSAKRRVAVSGFVRKDNNTGARGWRPTGSVSWLPTSLRQATKCSWKAIMHLIGNLSRKVRRYRATSS